MKSSFVVGVTLIVAHLHLHVQSFSTIARDSVEFSRQRTTAQSGSCQFVAPTADGSACNIFDLSGLPNVVYNISDSWPEPYLVASPCHTVDTSKCPACAQATPAGVVQLLGPNDAKRPSAWGCNGPRCIRCDGNDFSSPRISAGTATEGINITYGGGDGGRSVTYIMVCDPSMPQNNGPEPLMQQAYYVTWRTPLACGKPAAPTQCMASLPTPTPALTAWQEREIGALIHFNMATYGSCAPAATFNPIKLDTDQWAASFVALGVREAVLVAKHGCGFTTWPTKATVPGGGRYNYSVAYTTWQNGTGDVLSQFLESCNAKNIGTGFYYSLASNTFAQRMGWTADELLAIEKQHLLELWGQAYGNHAHGGHAEIWFDGGFEGPIKPFVASNLASLQPNAAVFNGYVPLTSGLDLSSAAHRVRTTSSISVYHVPVGIQQGAGNNASNCVSPNSVRWIGTESGTAPDPTWSTGFSGGGDPNGAVFQPAECDTTLQNGDQWFYNGNVGIRSLATMVNIYHQTVGRNGFLMLDFAPTPDGVLAADQVERYAQVGTWIKQCYGTPIAIVAPPAGPNATVVVPAGALIDRVVLRENQTQGQLIRSYVIETYNASSGWVQVGAGQSVGNKAIVLFPSSTPVAVTAVRVRVLGAAPGGMALVQLRDVAVYKCNRPSDSGCTTTPDTKVSYTPPDILATLPGLNVSACCTACSARPTCAVFLVSPQADCILLTADGVGLTAKGWTSGSPN